MLCWCLSCVGGMAIAFQLILYNQTLVLSGWRRSGENRARSRKKRQRCDSSAVETLSQSDFSEVNQVPEMLTLSVSSSGVVQRAAVSVREAGPGDQRCEASEAAVRGGLRHHSLCWAPPVPLPEAVPGVGLTAAGEGHPAPGHHGLRLQAPHGGQPLGLAPHLQHLQNQLGLGSKNKEIKQAVSTRRRRLFPHWRAWHQPNLVPQMLIWKTNFTFVEVFFFPLDKRAGSECEIQTFGLIGGGNSWMNVCRDNRCDGSHSVDKGLHIKDKKILGLSS